MKILEIDDEYQDFLHDESRREGRAERIAFPRSSDEVCEALCLASENNWPVTIQGGRTGITGGCVPDGGLILNLSRMNAICGIVGDKMTVQPGAALVDIRAALSGSGLFFPSDLTETSALIGGMVANNASGARSFRYGSVRGWIHALEVVLADSKVVRVERGMHRASGYSFRAGHVAGSLPEIPAPDVKNAAGYFVKPDMDLVDLFIGSEGTLGIVTEIELQLKPAPDRMVGLTAFFSSESDSLAFVRFLRDTDWCTLPTAIEFFDANALDLLRRMKAERPAFSELPELHSVYHTAIYFEFEGEAPDRVVEYIESHAVDCWFAEGDYEIATLKNFRHAIPESVNLLIGERRKSVPGLTKLGTDMSVPDERLEEVMQMYHDGLESAGMEYVIFGHIGNNHVHVNILPRSLEEYERGQTLYLEWARQIVGWGGSVSAEHGIGKGKTAFLQLMFGDSGIRKMRALKKLFDPEFRLNPGNLFE
ncbi:MAG: FAD-binding oxidoreductase [Pontiellaceae bacterium]|nr:FAD-binding oxidoreductase [Pontiellaceae bacterium]MBN2784884.1 FAD-binding oxidoreductase [Pontiellaceae bacterium]